MEKKSYSELLKDPRWQRKRLEILQRDDFKCRSCGENILTLNVHHLAYNKNIMPWEIKDDLLMTLCEKCHSALHIMSRNDIGIESFVNVSLLLNKIGY